MAKYFKFQSLLELSYLSKRTKPELPAAVPTLVIRFLLEIYSGEWDKNGSLFADARIQFAEPSPQAIEGKSSWRQNENCSGVELNTARSQKIW